VLEDLTVHLEGKDIMKEMKFIILEQKFLEHIYAGKTFQALKVLQLEIRSEPQRRVTFLRIQQCCGTLTIFYGYGSGSDF
jgi:hypothetical protein